MDELAIDKVQRRILANQYRLFALLDPSESASYERTAEIFENGYEGLYHEVFEPIFDPLAKDECSFVFAVLNLFHELQHFAGQFPELPADLVTGVKFPGFSELEEIELLAFARFIASWPEDGNVFKRLMDFHPPPRAMSPQYRRMLAKYHALRAGPRDLTVDDIKQILGASR